MSMTLVGLFEDETAARAAAKELEQAGVARGKIRVSKDAGADVPSMLSGADVPQDDAEIFGEGIRRGGTLLTAVVDDAKAEEAQRLLERRGAIDVDERAREWRKGGWTGSGAIGAGEGEVKLPVVKEEMKVGKREVSRGGVRAFTQVNETPVEKDIRLREERVTVDRRPADRPASEAEVRGFREGSIEVNATAEEAVVSKQPRVIEEVVINKEVNERTHTVRDTVRKTDVRVEPVADGREFSAYDQAFQTDYQTNRAASGYTYDQYAPAYRYGYNLANDPQYRDKDWTDVESSARTQWEEHNKGTWESFKDAIRHAWDSVRGRDRVSR